MLSAFNHYYKFNIIYQFLYESNISYEQLDMNPEIKTFKYSNGTLYYNYENPRIEIVFKYPSNWKILEFINNFLLMIRYSCLMIK